MEIAREARKFLELAASSNPRTGAQTLSASDIRSILDNTDDPKHAYDTIALAMLDLLLECNGEIRFTPASPVAGGSA